MNIASIIARSIFDSRGFPTVEVDVILADGTRGRAAVPSGASTGSREAIELRDGDPKAYDGKGVTKAIQNINNIIAPAIIGWPAWDQRAIDRKMCELDGTANKSNLGANSILAVSLAVAKAQASFDKIPLYRHIARIAGNAEYSLPMPLMNILNGGAHAQNSTDIQEFMIIPQGATTLQQALQMGADTFHSLKKLLSQQGLSTTVGDEGGFAPALSSNTQALDLIMQAIANAGYKPGQDIAIGLDVAASELVCPEGYDFKLDHKKMTANELIQWYDQLTIQYPIVSIEDGLGEDDWTGWQALEEKLGVAVQLVGDDLLVTNTDLLQQAITKRAANAILIKPNQIGTLSETIDAVMLAKQNMWGTIISHRSGETEDTTIAHLAVGLNAGQIKTGSMSRSERTAKYNELLRISEIEQIDLSNTF